MSNLRRNLRRNRFGESEGHLRFGGSSSADLSASRRRAAHHAKSRVSLGVEIDLPDLIKEHEFAYESGSYWYYTPTV